MPKACNVKKGNIININGAPYQVKQIDVQTPSARGANTLYKIRFSGVTTGQKLDQTYKGNDMLEELALDRRAVSYIFKDASGYTFMDAASFEQYTLSEESLEGQLLWLTEGQEDLTALLLDGRVLCIELPATVDLEVVETAPGIKGATATNRNKPAVLANGHTVMVPEYLETGEVVRVNTETGKYMSRAKD
ncbi:MAG: elongation factor P-like protein YeiP [Pseudomonadota bacterium]